MSEQSKNNTSFIPAYEQSLADNTALAMLQSLQHAKLAKTPNMTELPRGTFMDMREGEALESEMRNIRLETLKVVAQAGGEKMLAGDLISQAKILYAWVKQG